ncbi:preprotein translocase subunit SecE [Fodinicola feengrottensis]|uniref:preprotein translocase subunit SecE n=1 Tax=Fodinicola feengrottensis TaxID=435914 RepID=UPI0024423464|nr:preprotein translocase subunit SecE [Fodinicola feengrottensis]
MAKGKGSAPADDEADAVLPDDTDTTQDDADAVDDSAEESGESRRSSDKSDRKSDRPKSKRGGGRTNPVSCWVLRFVREVVAELGKVIWPTRKDLITYTLVVVVFLVVMVALVAGLDVGFERLALLVFGGGTSS